MKIHTMFSDPADGVVALLYAQGHHRLAEADFLQAATATLAEHVYDKRRAGWLGQPHHDAAASLFRGGPTYEVVATPVTVIAVDETRFRQLAHDDAIAEIELLDYAQDRWLGEFTTDEDFALAARIADRAAALYSTRSDVRRSRTEILMTIIAVHERCMPLCFADWLAVENNPRFVHDIIGIDQHLDRASLQLKATFCPRFAA